MQKHDVLIVGAGMVGLTLALAIRKQSNLTVALIDNNPLTPISDEPDIRVSALNAVSQQLLDNLSVWETIKAERCQPYTQMHVWDKASGETLEFSQSDLPELAENICQQSSEQNLGYIVENNVIRHALWQQCLKDQGIHFVESDQQLKITDISFGESEAFVSFTNQAPMLTSLVVGADGANSWVRKHMNFNMAFRDYDHHAIVCTVKCSQGHQQTAWQVFTETGPLAFLPLASHSGNEQLCSIVWSTSPEQAQRLQNLSAEEFSKEISQVSDGKLGFVTLASERVAYPLSMRLCQSFAQQRVALVGDAAHTIHPLAGQGVNLGFLDAAALAESITQVESEHAASSNNALSSELLNKSYLLTTKLNAYSRWRKAHASEMVAAMEAIKQVFTPQQLIFQSIRSVGLSLLNAFKPAKKLLLKNALGYRGQLPNLAKPKKK